MVLTRDSALLPACLVAPLHSSTCFIPGTACPAPVGSDGPGAPDPAGQGIAMQLAAPSLRARLREEPWTQQTQGAKARMVRTSGKVTFFTAAGAITPWEGGGREERGEGGQEEGRG